MTAAINAEQIKDILQAYIEAEERDVRIYREKKIGSAVCDLMAVTDILTGYEIKSDLDNFSRLPSQINAYDMIFNKNYIVVGAGRANSVAEKVPDHWGIICIDGNSVNCVREARVNRNARAEQQLSMLWEVELKNLLIRNNLPAYALKGRQFIIERLVQSVCRSALFGQVAAELKSRNYALFYGDEDGGGENVFGRELIDRLSDAIGDNFTLDKWIELFGRAKSISERKHGAALKIEKNRKPHAVSYKDIEVSLGAPWISVDIVNDFVYHILDLEDPEIYKKLSNWLKYDPYIVSYEEVTGSWYLREKEFFGGSNPNAVIKYGTKKYNALHIIEATLNLREVRFKDCRDRYDERFTIAVLEKQRLICDEFKDWVWKDEDRIWEIEEAYNAMFDGIVVPRYDGRELVFPDMCKDIKLFDHQKDAVQKIISSPNTLLAFDVGAGKTYIMIAASMEMRRQGISRKNMFVVPNNIVGQWALMFTTLYPSAKVLVIEPRTFKKEMRHKVLEQARSGDYDGIIVAYSCFEMINLSKEYIAASLDEKVSVLRSAIQGLTVDGRRRWGDVPLEREIKYINSLMIELMDGVNSALGEIAFEKLGINTLFVDEAHNYKNIPIRTNLKNLRGINVTGSKKCLDMLEKIKCVQKQNGGRGVVFATGTPLCNSVSDVYAMQMYLQPEALQKRRLDRFDNWVKTFARPEQVCEIDVNASGYRFVRRFSKFFNLPELSKLFAQVSVFFAADGGELPEFSQYNDIVIERSEELAEYIDDLCLRTENIRAKKVSATQDNMLKITTDGRKAALDLTLVGRQQKYDDTSKIFNCAENVLRIYKENTGCTQLVFCDYSTPNGADFSVYRELKKKLVAAGIPENEIAFIHSYTSEMSRLKLYEDFNTGKVRIIIGSTFKLGLGANVQKKLKAIHHIDVPWRPADMVQREGRILRRGNENKEVFIYRYIIKGSFDAYSWQILETKQRFISQFLSGSSYSRTASDLENSVLTYSEVKALAVSDPRMKSLAEKASEVRNLRVLYMQELETREEAERTVSDLEERIPVTEAEYKATLKNAAYVLSLKKERLVGEIKLACENINRNDLLTPHDGALGEICGFVIGLPVKQAEKHPYLLISRNGASYTMEAGTTVQGNMRRFSNFFGGFGKQVNIKGRALVEEKARLAALKLQLSAPLVYDKKLAAAKAEYDGLIEDMRGDIRIQ